MTTESTIRIDGTATKEMTNDVLAITFRVTKDGTDSNAVQQQLREAVYAALEIVRPAVKEGEVGVETDSFQVQPRYGKTNQKIDGYVGTAGITVKGTDTAAISKLAAEIKTMIVSGSSNSVSRKAKAAAEAELTQQAIASFREKADAAAKGFMAKGWVVGDIAITIQGDRPMGGKMFAMSASASMESAPMSVESGKSDLTAYVQGTIVLSKTKVK